MKQAKSIFNEAEKFMAHEAVCIKRTCSRFVLMFALLSVVFGVQSRTLSSDAIGLSLNFDMKVHMNIEVISGVIDPALASICRSAAQPRNSANAAPNLRA
jgi:hypothetical protein